MPETTETGTIYPECTALCSDIEQDRDAMLPIVEAAFGLVSSWRIMGSVVAPDTTPAALLAAVEAYEASAIRHGSSRGAPTTPTVGEETPATDPGHQKTAESLVADLVRVSANLEEHIQTRANEIAAPRVAQAESVAVGKIAEVIAQAEHDKQRSDDLLAELRRVLAAQCKNVDLYWPQVTRVKALADAWRKAGMDGEAQDIYEALHPKEAEVTTNA